MNDKERAVIKAAQQFCRTIGIYTSPEENILRAAVSELGPEIEDGRYQVERNPPEGKWIVWDHLFVPPQRICGSEHYRNARLVADLLNQAKEPDLRPPAPGANFKEEWNGKNRTT